MLSLYVRRVAAQSILKVEVKADRSAGQQKAYRRALQAPTYRNSEICVYR
jgi:hypothetical protein